MDKWYYIAVIVGILMYGAYEMEKLYFDRLDALQKQSQVVVEK